ncbi:hypothetical protein EB796_008311 [Bugula neritina]|uniref:Apple domain-containing protein n=1 Tax=Bugula neritina TaxID=10212 RepID=A0A7J7K633_BUGNE|nr:hypothetical protein EB796_008311 [Bugula neritina]
MIKQPNGSCVAQADQTVEQVYSLRKCVKKCLRSNIDCQGVTYDDNRARCILSRKTSLKPCDSDTSPVTYTTSNDLESYFVDTTASTVASTTTITDSTETTRKSTEILANSLTTTHSIAQHLNDIFNYFG